MRHYSPFTLLASVFVSFGLHAAVVETDPSDHYQVSESVSSVVYKSQQAAPVSSAVVPLIEAKYSTDAAVISLVKQPKTVLGKQMPVNARIQIVAFPAKVTPVLPVTVNSAVRSIQPLPLVVLSKPVKSTIPTVIMPTTVPVHPILNTTGLARQDANEEQDEPSLFSAFSDWFSVKPVKPWQKGTLAKKAMKPGGEVPEFDVFSEKVFAYKQGSIGGNGVGGGGCGCN